MRRRLIRALIALALLAIAFAVLILLTPKAYPIASSAMEPTLHCAKPADGCQAKKADRVFVSRVIYRLRDPRRGDLVAFHLPTAATLACGSFFGEAVIKRLIGVPGDRFREKSGFVYINGKKLNEPYVTQDNRDAETFPEVKVRKGQYLVLGDNRSSSCDSRQWGPVPRKNLIGPVIATYWPLSRISIR